MSLSINVNLGPRSYPIFIEQGLAKDPANRLTQLSASNFIVISDSTVASLYGTEFIKSLDSISANVQLLTFPDGETSKSSEYFVSLCESILKKGADRQSVVVALGGGVTGDLAGYVAASFMRGLQFVQVPTTLLAQVDSSVGGKVGINLPDAKNIIGAFWQPSMVLIDPNVLTTLDDRQYAAGLAEVIKYGVILDESFFSYLESHVDQILDRQPDVLAEIISRCCQLKAIVVEEDETELSGRRAILNYGHTFGHAIENLFGYGTYLHGEAIAIGMHCAARLAKNLNRVDQAFVDRQSDLLARFQLPFQFPACEALQILEQMRLDKKNQAQTINLILPIKVGQVEIVSDVPDEQIRAVLR